MTLEQLSEEVEKMAVEISSIMMKMHERLERVEKFILKASKKDKSIITMTELRNETRNEKAREKRAS